MVVSERNRPAAISLMTNQRLTEIAARFPHQRILVIGDLMLDEYIWGKVSRISPEAPVPVVQVTSESYYPGGAANVARNAREFTEHVAVVGLAGADAAGERLIELLEKSGIDTSGSPRDAAAATTLKTRIIARNQQVVRVDRDRRSALTPAQTERVMESLGHAIAQASGVIVADYGKGFVTQTLADFIGKSARALGKVLTVDPHPHTSLIWRGATAIKPNRAEAFLAAGMPQPAPVEPALDDHALLEAVRHLRALWQTESLLVTLGEQGVLLFHGDATPYHAPALAKDVFDVSGAGDTAIAALTLSLCAGASPREAAEIANCASGIAVGKLGTATVSAAELLAACARL
jgi:D-beta-D-heptose 7-phosphate kinase/D-beta-D-heptose 1-phosphate adenosyltransferase